MLEKEVRLIDANALDTLLEDVEKGYKKNFLFKSAKELRWIRDAISALRTIDPESLRPHGKWIHCNGKSNLWYCSECGNKVLYNSTRRTYNIEKKPISEINKYCRNCGAKMEGAYA